jgi:hypothetical protein
MALVGCGSSESVAPVDPVAEKTAIAESKAAWNPEKVEAFKKAHAEDGRQTPGQKQASGSQAGQPAK